MKIKISVVVIILILVLTGGAFWHNATKSITIDDPKRLIPSPKEESNKEEKKPEKVIDVKTNEDGDEIKKAKQDAQKIKTIGQNSVEDFDQVTSDAGFRVLYDETAMEPTFIEGELGSMILFYPRGISEEIEKHGLGDVLEEMDLMSNMERFSFPIYIQTIKPNEKITNLKDWIYKYIIEDEGYDSKMRTVYKNFDIVPMSNGSEWTLLKRNLLVHENNNDIRIKTKDYFMYKNGNVYHMSIFELDDEYELPKYNEEIHAVSDLITKNIFAIERSFAFGDFNMTEVIEKEQKIKQMSNEEAVEKLKIKNSFLKKPYFNFTKERGLLTENVNECSEDIAENTSDFQLSPSPGIYFEADYHMIMEGEEKPIALLHAFDKKGGHTGLIDIKNGQVEEHAQGFLIPHVINGRYLISMRENQDGELKLVGKGYGSVRFTISGDGDSCTFSEVDVLVTPETIVTIPISETGAIGPMSYRINGEKEFEIPISFKYPFTDKKEKEIWEMFTYLYRQDKGVNNK